MDNVSSEPYLSGYTYSTFATHRIPDDGDTKYMLDFCSGVNPQEVKDGDVIYVTGMHAHKFLVETAPQISSDFFMITAQWDPGITDEWVPLFPPNLKKWWTINAHTTHEKIVPIPLGLQNLNWGWDGNKQSDPNTYKQLRDTKKEYDVLASFSIGNNCQERLECVREASISFDGLNIRNFQSSDRKNEDFVSDYFETASKHRFVLCPHGAGADTHRMWEALYMKCIPITKRCSAFRDFEDYPIIFVDNWKELSGIDLEREYNEKVNLLEQEERIYADYWRKQINDRT